MRSIAKRVVGFGTTIFAEINDLARRHGAINLGQGAPDFDGPPEVLAAAVEAVNGALNQYAPGIGMPSARRAIARHAERFYGQQLDPEREVLITSGATEGMFAAILGLTDPCDEVIVFEPVYDTYVPNLVMAGAMPRYLPLRGERWNFDPDELAKSFNSHTRAIIINTPHNPTGKVYSPEELGVIAELCLKHDVIAITDEVYEHILYDDVVHTRLATLPGMRERTLTISSLGKTFSVTGWKVGWVLGSAELVNAVNQAHQYITYAVASPLQAAAATALVLPFAFFEQLQSDYRRRRDRTIEALEKSGFKVFKPSGSFFVMADWRGVAPARVQDDYQFARWLTVEIGVACIPVSPFYQESDKHLGKHWARFAVCKRDETLAAAAGRLGRLGGA